MTNDKLMQPRIEGYVLRNWYSQDIDQKIANIMLKENIPYDEAKQRVKEAIKALA